MGNVFISLDEESEGLLRRLAREDYGGKKGAIRVVVSDALHELAFKKRRLRAARRQLDLMDAGFDFGLKGRKPYQKRGEIYD